MLAFVRSFFHFGVFQVCLWVKYVTSIFIFHFLLSPLENNYIEVYESKVNPSSMLSKNQTTLFNIIILAAMRTFKFNFPQIMKIGHICVCRRTTGVYVPVSE